MAASALRVGHQGLCFHAFPRVNKGHMSLHGIVQTSDNCRGMLIVQSACCLQFDARHGPVIALVWPACDGAELSGDLDEHCPLDAHCPQLCHRRFLVSVNVFVLPRPQQCRGICPLRTSCKVRLTAGRGHVCKSSTPRSCLRTWKRAAIWHSQGNIAWIDGFGYPR